MAVIPPRLCPVPSCDQPAARGHELCLPCWRKVSPTTQRMVEKAFRMWRRGQLDYDRYHEAVWTAVRSAREYRRRVAIRSRGRLPAPEECWCRPEHDTC